MIPAVAALLVALVPSPSPAPPPCWPEPNCPAGNHDYRTILAFQASFTPSDIPDVHYGLDWLSFLNVDVVAHTATDTRCLDLDAGSPCAFDITLTPIAQSTQQWQQGGNTVVIGSPNPFVIGETYSYVCRNHEGMGGTFTVVR